MSAIIFLQCLAAPMGVLVTPRVFGLDRARSRLNAAGKVASSSPRPGSTRLPRDRIGHALRTINPFSTRWRRLAAASVAFLGAISFVAFPLAAALSCAIAISGSKLSKWRVLRESRRLDEELVPFVEAVSRSLRAGVTGLESVRDATVLFDQHQAFRDLSGICRRSGSVAQALSAWEESLSTASSHRVVQLLRLGDSIGGLRPQFVDGIARTLRESNQLASEIRVLSDQARYSAILMTAAPIVFSFVLAGTDARSKHFLLETELGAALVVVGLLLDAAGLAWMHRLIRQAGAR